MPQSSMSESKAVVFDAYGTLFDPHTVARLCDERFPGRGEKLSRVWRRKQLEYSWTLALMGRYEDFWSVTERALRYATEALALSADPSTMDRIMDAYLHLKPYPEVPAALERLSGRTRAILSNGTPAMLEPLVASAGLEEVFDDVISVDAVRTYKPEPLVYQLAAQRLRVEPEEILFVSSNGWDAAGAKAFGLRVCWVNRSGAPEEALDLAPDHTIESLDALPDLLT